MASDVLPGPSKYKGEAVDHYPLEEWTDYARGLIPAERGAEMADHLRFGCEPCSQSEAFLRQVWTIARNSVLFRPPEGAVCLVKSTLAAIAGNEVPFDNAVFARLTFDSAIQRHAAGFRGLWTPTNVRQLLYDASPHVVDICLERIDVAAPIHLTGQILCGSGVPVGALPVLLGKRAQVLRGTMTNPLGEFRLDIQSGQARDLMMSFRLGPDETICLNLPDAAGVEEA